MDGGIAMDTKIREIQKLVKDMENFFGVDMPSVVNYPESFKYYMVIYKHFRGA